MYGHTFQNWFYLSRKLSSYRLCTLTHTYVFHLKSPRPNSFYLKGLSYEKVVYDLFFSFQKIASLVYHYMEYCVAIRYTKFFLILRGMDDAYSIIKYGFIMYFIFSTFIQILCPANEEERR